VFFFEFLYRAGFREEISTKGRYGLAGPASGSDLNPYFRNVHVLGFIFQVVSRTAIEDLSAILKVRPFRAVVDRTIHQCVG
jgi:hypothetical protein